MCPGRVAQLVVASSVHQRVAGSMSGKGAYRRQPIDVSLSYWFFFLSLPSPLSKINKKHILRWGLKRRVWLKIFRVNAPMSMWGVMYVSEKKVYSVNLKLYWMRVFEHAEIYLVTQYRSKKTKVKIANVYFSYCPFLASPKLSLPVTVLPLLLGTLSHAEHHPSPFSHRCCPRSFGFLQWCNSC